MRQHLKTILSDKMSDRQIDDAMNTIETAVSRPFMYLLKDTLGDASPNLARKIDSLTPDSSSYMSINFTDPKNGDKFQLRLQLCRVKKDYTIDVFIPEEYQEDLKRKMTTMLNFVPAYWAAFRLTQPKLLADIRNATGHAIEILNYDQEHNTFYFDDEVEHRMGLFAYYDVNGNIMYR